MSALTASEQLFEAYLAEDGYQFAHEPYLGIVKRPAYLIARAGTEAGLRGQAVPDHGDARQAGRCGPRVGMLSSNEVFGAVRNQLDAAARQQKPLAGGRLSWC